MPCLGSIVVATELKGSGEAGSSVVVEFSCWPIIFYYFLKPVLLIFLKRHSLVLFHLSWFECGENRLCCKIKLSSLAILWSKQFGLAFQKHSSFVIFIFSYSHSIIFFNPACSHFHIILLSLIIDLLHCSSSFLSKLSRSSFIASWHSSPLLIATIPSFFLFNIHLSAPFPLQLPSLSMSLSPQLVH